LKEGIMVGEGVFMMSREELRRVGVVQRVLDGEITQGQAAEVLGVCERQVRRLVRRVRDEGEEGLIHRGRGRSSSRALGGRLRRRVIGLCRRRYVGFGPTLASEKLREEERIVLSRETLRSWFREEHMPYRRRRGRAHRRWRERKSCFGEMVQVDGSHHDWFEGRGGRCVLMGYIDDATGEAFGRFYPFEGTIPALDSFGRYVRRYGIPMSVYLDKHSTYKSTRRATIEEELRDVEPMSEVERALGELGVKVIHADSPQAKGRIERLFRTLQDRLVKEMRLRGIGSIEAANEFLEEYLPVYNERFRVAAAGEADLHRRIPIGIRLDRVLCVKSERFLRNDFTVAYNGKLYQIEDRTRAKKVVVEERTGGSMAITYKGKILKFTEIGERPKRRKGPGAYRHVPRKVYRPPREHPWNTYRESTAAHASAQGGKNGRQGRRVPARMRK
jgi:transposase